MQPNPWEQRWHSVRRILGVPEHPTSWTDRAVSSVISVIGIAIVVVISQATRPDSSPASLWLVGSIGATAVLVFAVPHGPLSQPWAVICGQGVSALVGVVVAHSMGGGTTAKAVSVGGAIAAMHVCRCIHPPGGATSLAAVLMVAPGHEPSWLYPLTPAILNGVIIVAAATALNWPFVWRRYPLALAFPKSNAPAPVDSSPPPVTAEQLRVAFHYLDTLVTICDEEVEIVYRSLHRQLAMGLR